MTKKVEFNHHHNYDNSLVENHEFCDQPSVIEDVKVMSTAEQLQRMLTGNIVDKTVQTAYWANGFDDIDVEKLSRLDETELQSIREINTKRIQAVQAKIDEIDLQKKQLLEVENQRKKDFDQMWLNFKNESKKQSDN